MTVPVGPVDGPCPDDGAGNGSAKLLALLKSRYSRLSSLYADLGAPEDALKVVSLEIQRVIESILQEEERKILGEIGRIGRENEALDNKIALIKSAIGGMTMNTILRQVSSSGQGLDKLNLNQINAKLMREYESSLKIYQERLSKVSLLREQLSAHGCLPSFPNKTGSDYEDVSDASIASLQKALTAAKVEHARRIEQARNLASEVVEAWAGLEYLPTEPGELMILEISKMPIPSTEEHDIFASKTSPSKVVHEKEAANLIVTAAKMTEMQSLLESLLVRKAENERKIQDLYDIIFPLWERLMVPETERDAFVAGWTGSSDTIVTAYKEELERVEKLKRENMAAFFANTRRLIEELCDSLYKSGPERTIIQDKIDAAGDDLTDETLAKHEDLIAELQMEYERKRPILESIRKYEALLGEYNDFLSQTQDTSRLTQRGARGDPGRLLREEKFRKRIDREKPKLELDIHIKISEWEAENAKEFLVRGERYIELLAVKDFRGVAKISRAESSLGNASPVKARSVTSSQSHSSIRPITPSLYKAPQPKTPGQLSVSGRSVSASQVGPTPVQRTASRTGKVGGTGTTATGIKTPGTFGASQSHLPKPNTSGLTPSRNRAKQIAS